MTPEDVTLVVETVSSLRPRLAEVAGAFYAELFRERPELRALFPDQLTAQQQKFAAELDAIVVAIPDLTRFADRAADLGARHVDYGVRVGHYTIVGRVLRRVLADAMGPQWTERHEAAWVSAYDLVAEAMLLGTAHAHP